MFGNTFFWYKYLKWLDFKIKIIFLYDKINLKWYFTLIQWQFLIIKWYFTVEKYLEWIFDKINILTIFQNEWPNSLNDSSK